MSVICHYCNKEFSTQLSVTNHIKNFHKHQSHLQQKEEFAVISGSTEKNTENDLMNITSIAQKRYANYKTAHHEWINNVENSSYRDSLNRIRINQEILNKIHERFPDSTVKNVTEADEIYWAVSPIDAVGSDRSLVDCHYDAPFSWFPTGGVVFYRVIIACNENNDVTTIFPTENIKVKMTTSDFHGLDYNKDWHCVEGSIPKGKYRVLLKMHYLIIPKDSEAFENWVRWINVNWTIGSRETMRMSANPQNFLEWLVALIVSISRVVFNNSYICILIVCIIIGATIYLNSQRFKMN